MYFIHRLYCIGHFYTFLFKYWTFKCSKACDAFGKPAFMLCSFCLKCYHTNSPQISSIAQDCHKTFPAIIFLFSRYNLDVFSENNQCW